MAKVAGFQCKQFFVAHDQCAMKVGTDSLVLGSWVEPENVHRVLDIGTGSGLLALMVAQKTPPECQIRALDIDPSAVAQASSNFAKSPWHAKLDAQLSDVKQLNPATPFDLIVANPPYFQDVAASNSSIAGMSSARKQARLAGDLSFTALLDAVVRCLAANGHFYCVIPTERVEAFIHDAQRYGLSCGAILDVKPTPSKAAKVTCLRLQRSGVERVNSVLVVRDALGHYTQEYRALCKDYYVNF